jgi:hypothetical protein
MNHTAIQLRLTLSRAQSDGVYTLAACAGADV